MDIFSSKYHIWPIINNNDRKYRFSENNFYKILSNFFDENLDKFSGSDEEILNTDFEKKLSKIKFNHKISLDELKKKNDQLRIFEQEKNSLLLRMEKLEKEKSRLIYDLEAIKKSKIWRYSTLLRKILDKLKY